jgi:AraC-like DNA-binding protein
VAYAVGYQSVSSFSRRFREDFAMTPGQWTQRASTARE